nr:immunoglobulin light chain junction region [Macaca mulatta]MOW02052.1 immunoglobulin light chain junction region [Macaca mulatta]MOW02076.1 immunoglobulin light chain junction region [Macaca mulatta]MOW02095.1 immunoglobulin light chain junction region [Macaca mulatta]MOW02171.1 immunoglobulin light chain junction region [Macaca mulatta]
DYYCGSYRSGNTWVF